MKKSAKKPTRRAAARATDDTVVHHASETLRVASERTRDFANDGVQRAKAGYEQLTQVAQDATEKARKSATETSLTVLDVVKEDADAAYDYARKLIGASCLSEAFAIQTSYLKGRFDKRVAQSRELSAYVGKLAGQFRIAA